MRATAIMRRATPWGIWVLAWGTTLAAADRDLRLVNALKQQDRTAARALLNQSGVDVNTPQGDGATALHWAAHWDDLETAALLIRAGANTNAANSLGVTPLELASENGNRAMVELLLTAGANANAAHSNGRTVLMTAARAGHVEVMKQLVAHGADLNAQEPAKGQTALMWAIAEGHRDMVRLLVEQGADVRARSKAGFTPLLFAARMGDLESARLLVAAGADVNEAVPKGNPGREGDVQRDRGVLGVSALLMATVRGHVELAKFLLDQGADPNADSAGYSALHWAAGSWEWFRTATIGRVHSQDPADHSALFGLQGSAKLEMVKVLLAHGADVNARVVTPRYNITDNIPRDDSGLVLADDLGLDSVQSARLTGATPFALAAAAGDITLMRLFVEVGGDPQLSTREGTTPLMLAAGISRDLSGTFMTENRALEATRFVLELGADVNAVNDAGNTALHGAAHMRYERLIQLLVERGARLNVKNKDGQTPLTIAERRLQGGANPITNERSSAGDLLRKLGAQ